MGMTVGVFLAARLNSQEIHEGNALVPLKFHLCSLQLFLHKIPLKKNGLFHKTGKSDLF
jgi:hypothetical protein